MNKFTITLTLILFSLGVASAGCCFDQVNGLCAANGDEQSCTNNGGMYNSKGCDSIDECSTGCCVLGETAGIMTQSECEIYASVYGFAADFRQDITGETCLTISNEQTYGACIYERDYINECYYTTISECIEGDFHEGIFCTDPLVGSRCEVTDDTICSEEGNVIYLDSCGNMAGIKEECDYSKGSICSEKNSVNAYCENLNCGAYSNGESWCSFEDLGPVGSQAFRQYCADGEVYTERCNDFRLETCESGSCVRNPASECMMVNPDSTADDYDASDDSWKESCDARYCEVMSLKEFLEENPEFTKDNETSDDSSLDARNPDSTIVSELLVDDLMVDLCVPKTPEGFQFWPTIGTFTYSSEEETICSKGDYSGTMTFRESDEEESLFDGGSSENDNEVLTSYSKITIGDIRLTSPAPYIYGNAGLISLDGDHWGYEDASNILCADENPLWGEDKAEWKMTDSNVWKVVLDTIKYAGYSLISSGNSNFVVAHEIFQYEIEFDGAKPVLKMDYEGCEKVNDKTTFPLQEGIVPYLKDRCKAIGDCGGKLNFIGQNGTIGITKNQTLKRSYLTLSYNFTCEPYRAPRGDGDCNQCNGGLPCSEYRCKSLGDQCEFVSPGGIDSGYCTSVNDHTSPRISSQVRGENGGSWSSTRAQSSFDYNEQLELEITTDEISQCKFNVGSSAGGSFSDTQNRVDDEYATTHKLRLLYPGQEKTKDDFYEQEILGDSGIVELYVYCEDARKNFNLAPHLIRLNINSPPDKIAPQMIDSSFVPSSGEYVPLNSSLSQIRFGLNEDGYCKWDTKDTEYNLMNHSFNCIGSICSGALPVTKESNLFYIKCKDVSGNQNIFSKVYTLLKSQSQLQIESILPTDLDTMDSHMNFTLEATVSGGAGDEYCEFEVEGYSSTYTLFNSRIGSRHTQQIDLPIGSHTIKVHCQDSAGDGEVMAQTIRINQDTNSPLMAKIYKQGASLVVKTTEPAECRFDYYTCTKDFDEMSAFSTKGLKHTMSSKDGKLYYIKCKDSLGNLPPKYACSRIVRT
jgi:hypothetical protein